MIISNLDAALRYESLHPLLPVLFQYVRTHSFDIVSAGRIELDGTHLYINVSDAVLKPQEKQPLEIHRQYIDVHFPISGNEICGWSHLSDLHTQPSAPYEEATDFALFDEPAQTYFTIRPGQFYICYPEDAHAPIIGEGHLRKLVAKVRI